MDHILKALERNNMAPEDRPPKTGRIAEAFSDLIETSTYRAEDAKKDAGKVNVTGRIEARYSFILEQYADMVSESKSGFIATLLSEALEEIMESRGEWKEMHERFLEFRKKQKSTRGEN